MGDKDDPADDQTDCKHGRDLSDRHEGSAARYRAKPRRDPTHSAEISLSSESTPRA